MPWRCPFTELNGCHGRQVREHTIWHVNAGYSIAWVTSVHRARRFLRGLKPCVSDQANLGAITRGQAMDVTEKMSQWRLEVDEHRLSSKFDAHRTFD